MKPEVSISCDLSLYSHFRFVSQNRLVETCCDRTKIVCCEQICRRSVNKFAADLIKTTRDRSVGTDCNNLLISTDLLQVVISDLLSLVSNRLVASCFNKSLRLCCQHFATDLFPQACYRLTKPTDLSRLVDNLPQAGKINSLRQTCENSGCVGEKQALAERRLKLQKTRDQENMRLQQAEERLTVKSELAECYAREKVFAEAEAAERGSRTKSTSMKHEQLMSGASNNFKSDNRPYEDNSEVLCETKRQLINSVRNREINPLTLNDLFIQQQTNAMALALPKPSVPLFGGNAMEYCDFIRAFENIIEANTKSSSARLYYLIQYTTGEVQELMRSCSAMDPERGYLEARKLLKKRFGQNYRIATAYVDKLTKGPVIKRKDNAAIQRLSVQLTSCMNTLTEIGYMSKIENPECLKLIIARLPYDTRKRWRVVADNITEDEERELSLRDVTRFVERQARIVNHPVFGNISADYDYTGKRSETRN